MGSAGALDSTGPARLAESVRGRTYLVRIEVEVPVGPHDDWQSLEDWLGDKAAWDVRHCDFLGGIATVNVVEHLEDPLLNDGEVAHE